MQVNICRIKNKIEINEAAVRWVGLTAWSKVEMGVIGVGGGGGAENKNVSIEREPLTKLSLATLIEGENPAEANLGSWGFLQS